ncbi:unnamed protein product [Withania somnifera]
MAAPGGPRPRNAPPSNYNPNALADGMQNLQVNRPNLPPSAPRPNIPFGQQPPFAGGPPVQQPPFAGGTHVSRPGPPPPGVFPRGPAPPSGPPRTGLPPPVAQSAPPFASRPPPPGVMPPSMGGAAPPSGSLPSALGPRPGPPGPFSSSPLTTGPAVPPPSSISSSVSNGPLSGGPGMMQGGARFPPPSNTMRPPFGAPPPAMVSHGASSQPSGMRSPFGSSSSVSTTPVTAQPPPPFSGSFQNLPPPSGSSPFAAPVQAMPPPMGAPYGTRSWQVPPHQPATSDYIVRDTGNCSPRYMRCTINQIPCTVDLLTTSAMQLALLVQPLALPHPSEEPLQVVDFGESGPVRCSRCKGYINPFVKFIDQGRRFICNLCGHTDETPRDYQCNLGPDGRRRDADERPELCRGTVEFVATKEYMVRDPMPAVYFFLIDVSMNAIQTGATAAACGAISQVISDLPDGPRILVGIATFDSTIHFYNLKRALQQCRQHLELLLESIPTMFQNNRTADSAFGAAVKAAFLAMKSTGGKLLVFQSVLPSTGIGALSAREAEGRTNVSAAEKEAHKLLQPADKTLKTMAIDFAEYQVCVDVFLTTQSYVDIASISVIPRTTGGQVYYYFPFSALADTAKLYNDLRWNITRPQGFEAVMRVRCSQGLQVQEYSGNYCKRIPTDVDLPAIDCDKTIMVTLKHDDKLQDGSECSFQSAILYTTINGQRRIRVSTLALPCTTMLSNLFRSADLDTQFACILKQAASEVPTAPLSRIREQVTNLCINILHSYRKFCATVSSSGQLILPEALKLLPLYTLALVKSNGLRTDGQIDSRSFWINYVSPLSAPLAIPLVYPRLVAIHELDTKENDDSLIPPSIPLSSEHINDNGVYLLENGEDCLIYVGNSADPNVIHQLLGIASVEEIPAQFVLQQYDNPLSKKLNDIINDIRRQRCNYLRLKLCKKGDSSGMLFLSHMVEDKTQNGLSYVEFLVHIHRHIQNKMA